MKRYYLPFAWLLVLSLALPPVWLAPQVLAADDALPPVVGGWVEVSTAEQLLYIDKHQADYVSSSIRLMNNIALTGVDNWKPFGGNGAAPFSGTFDGGGHRITGISIADNAGDNYIYAGFFGETTGIVKNVGVSVDIYAGIYAGGLAGIQSGGNIDRSFSTGIVRGKPPEGSVSAAGGLVGASNNASISRSFSTASVFTGSVANQYAAGLVASKGAGQVQDAYARGAVSNGSSTPYLYAGGFAGFLIHGTIERAYSTGDVPNVTPELDPGKLVNGFIGFANYTDAVSNSYYDQDTSGSSEGGASGATGRNSASMMDASTYTGWDFTSTWAIHSNVNDGYPYLRHEIVTETLPSAIKDEPYLFTLGAFAGADVALDWSVTGLPNGLTLDDSGKLEGTPKQTGSFNVVVTAVDAGGLSAQKTFELIVEAYAPEPAGFTIEPGAAYGTMKVSATLGSPGNAFYYTLTDAAVARPLVGDALPSEAIEYAPGDDISAASVGSYLTLYEADITGIRAWGSVLLEASHIQLSVGSVTGSVYGAGGAPIVGATVSIGAVQTSTDAEGGFAFANVAQGARMLHVEAAGYVTKDVAVTIVAGDSVAVGTIALELSPIAVNGVHIDDNDFSMTIGDAKRQLTATVQPAGASHPAVSWSSNRTTVATVSAAGEVTAVAPGIAVVTVTTVDGSFTDSVNVTVLAPPPNVGTVTGAVYGTGGAPIVGAAVSIGAAQIMTDAEGGFVLANIPQGSRTLRVEAAGYAAKEVAVAVVAGMTADVGALRLTASDSEDGAAGPTTAVWPASDKLWIDWNGGKLEFTFKKETAPDGRSVLRLIADATVIDTLFKTRDLAIITFDNEDLIVKLDLPAAALQQVRQSRPEAALELKINGAGYLLPLSYWPVLPENSVVTIAIAMSSEAGTSAVKDDLAKLGLELLAEPVDFAIYLDEKELKEPGGAYTVRTIALSDEPDPDMATVVRLDGETSPQSMPSVFRTAAKGVPEAAFYSKHNSLYAVVRSKRSFSDVQGHWAQRDIERLASKLIVDGKSDQKFDPEGRVTRAEFAALLTRSLGITETSGTASFADVLPNAWFAGAVGAAADAGLVAGYKDRTFRPDEAITREQMAAMIDRAIVFAAAEQTGATTASAASFEDVDAISDWAMPSIGRLLQAKVMEGASKSFFAPKSPATRAQCVVVLHRMLQNLSFINE
ncbi:S-layer homology domain-containing protein [Paenibacillus tarimensis]|uniref:S-layer homology domain-containing protein n=1 Tax=Paenibacillus tarimensis TaxID=416012 RepID=UPI001F4232CD|nr:S-layer homology domain-containing protein [Paenibacillus tarimensis]MCF2945136.1 S-layer homology domain-containing protein [Paenibacillus tarimensis]